MLTLVDLAPVYWPGWFMAKSAVRAYENAIEKLDWYRREFPRIVICCDSPISLRKEWCATYKAQREEKPVEAIEAWNAVQNRVADWGLPVVRHDGFEGEDIVASLAAQAWPEETQIVGVDKDLYALISDTVWIASPKGRIDSNACFEKWGVVPSQMTDFLAMVGDATDNIQGCPNCGPGRAADLLTRFDTLAGIKEASDEEVLGVRGVGKKTLASLREWDPTMALKLVRLMDNAPIRLEELWQRD